MVARAGNRLNAGSVRRASASLAFVLVGASAMTACQAGPVSGDAAVPPSTAPAVVSASVTARPVAPVVPEPAAPPTVTPSPDAPGGLSRPADAEGPYRISRVVDGDTDKVSINGRTVTLRLIGIDTPETKDPRKPVQCFGEQASARAAQLLTGRSVWLEYDSTQDRRDRYGRSLVYVWLDGHTMFNELMVREGYAHEYTYDLPYRYQQRFRDAQVRRAERTARVCGTRRRAPATRTGPRTPSAPWAPTPPPTSAAAATPAMGSDGAVYYASCAAVRTAGKAPLLRGQPGYRSKLDGDRDGVACE